MKIFLILSIFGLILFSSCGKKRTIHIVAKNAATGVPYAGLEYFVVSSRTAADGEKYRTEAHGTLNDNGEAMVELRQKNRTYSVRVVEPANTCYNKQITQYFDSQYDVNGTFTFEFAECASLQINIKNINCFDLNDILSIYRTHSISNFYENAPNPAVYTGCVADTGNMNDAPMGWYKYHGTVTKNGIVSIIKDSIYLNPGEIKVWDIFY